MRPSLQDANKHAVMVPMSRLKSVTTLIVSGTEFNRTSLDMVVDDLPLLDRIDISCTKVLKYVLRPNSYKSFITT